MHLALTLTRRHRRQRLRRLLPKSVGLGEDFIETWACYLRVVLGACGAKSFFFLNSHCKKSCLSAVTHALTDGGAPLRSHARRTGSCAGLPVSISGTTTSLLAGIPELNPGGARLRLLRAHGLFLPFLAILRRSSPSTSPSTAPCRPRRPRSMQLPALRAQRPLEAPPSSPSATTPSTR